MRSQWIAVSGLCLTVLFGTLFADDSKTVNFTGTVTDSDGAAIGAASLNLYLMTVDQVSFSYQVRLVGKTTSDTEGKFAFSADPGDIKGYTVYCCLAQKEGFACGWATAMAENEAIWKITLTEPQKIIGFVQNPDGTGIPDAEVRLLILSIPGNQEQVMFGIEPVDAFVTKTCSDGRFEFANLPQDATVEFLVKKPGKGTLHTLDLQMDPETGLTYKAGETEIILTMQNACRVSGVVVTKEGQKPVDRIPVIARDTKLPVNLYRQPVESAEDGAFEIADLTPGDYTVMILSDEWIAEPVQLDVQSDMGTKIELVKGGMLEVKVVEAETKEVVSGVSVNVRDEQTQQYQQFQTNDEGIGSKQLLPGTYNISAYKQGYRSSNEAGSVVVMDGQTAELTVELGGQPKIKGVVTDSNGKTIEGAVVQLIPNYGPERDGKKTDEKGKFAISWDPGQMGWTEGEFYLLATHPDRKLAGVLQIGEDTREVTIKLEKGITAKGKVVNQGGEPIREARILLYFQGSNFGSPCGLETQTGADGEYEFNPLAADQRYSVSVINAAGYGTGQEQIEPTSDEFQMEVKDIILQVADRKVTGQVVDVDDKGLANVQLHCYGQGQPNINTKTDNEGRFILEPVCAGEINISANYHIGQESLYGHVQTEGGAEDVKVIVTSQGGSQRFVPKKAASLIGKPLPDLTECGVEVPQDANDILVFFWDMNQRPSRHFIKELNTKADLLKEQCVTVLPINVSMVEKEKLDTWLSDNGIAYPCGIITENAEDIKFKMGVQGLPWLILTDPEHKIIAEGISVEELEKKLNSK